MEIAYSVNGIPIRLTEERWAHIVDNKPYMETYYERILEAIEKPTLVLRGYAGALVAILSVGRQRYLHVVYKEPVRKTGSLLRPLLPGKSTGG